MSTRQREVGRYALAAVLSMLASAGAATAQTDEDVAIGVSVSRASARLSGFGAGVDALSGTLFGVDGRASLWWLHARGEYRQGRLTSELPGEASRDAVFARASVGIRPVPWLALTAGPRIGTVDSDDSSRRVVRWRIELHGSAPLIPEVAWGFASIGGSIGGNDVDWGGPSGGGGEVGVRFSRPNFPLWATLGYRMDRDQHGNGSWQAVETVYLGVGVSPTVR
jgi:hypothetical protein